MQPRILFIQPSICGIGGIERVIPIVARALKERGYEVSTISLYDTSDCHLGLWSTWSSVAESVTRGWVHRLTKSISRIAKIIRLVHETQPSLIVVSAQGTSLIVMVLKVLGVLRMPVCVYVHQSLQESDSFYGPVSMLLYRFADALICVSQGLATEVRSVIGGKVPIITAYNPVPGSEGSVQRSDAFSVFARPYLISVSRLERIKGVDRLIRCFARYAQRGPGTLFIVGDGSAREELEEMVENLNLKERVRFLGPVAAPRTLMAMADIYVSYARSEAFGVALVEALSEGVPVVATDCSYGPREILSPGTQPDIYPFKTPYGYLLDPRDDASDTSLNEVIAAILDMPESFAKEALRARAADFDTEQVLKPVLDIVGKLVRV